MTEQNKPRSQSETSEEEARKRAQACNREIAEVLAKHRCSIVPMLASEGVGSGPGMKLLLSATYGVIPNMEGG